MTRTPLHMLVTAAEREEGNDNPGKITSADIKQRLLEVLDTEQAIVALQELRNRPTMSPLEVLQKIGFDIKSMTAAQKEVAETYRGMLQEEREARRELGGIAEQAKREAEMAQIEVLKLLVQNLSENQKAVAETQAKLVEEVKNILIQTQNKPAGQNDPFTEALRGVLADVLKLIVGRVFQDGQGRPASSPVQEMLAMLDALEALEKRIRPKAPEVPGDKLTARDIMELEKFKLELEAKREQFQQELKAREMEGERWRQTLQMLGDAIRAGLESGALGSLLGRRAGPESNEMPAATIQSASGEK